MRVEHLGPGDVARYRAIRLRALSGDPDAFGSRYEDEKEMPEASWAGRLESADATLVVGREGSDVGLCVVAGPGAGDAGLYSVWVAPEARGQGVGEALVGEALRVASACGYARLVLEVSDENGPARALYERLGFVETGRTGAMPPPREHIKEREYARQTG